MGAIKEAIQNVFRDFNTDGVEASGRYSPDKAALRALGELLETAIGNVGLGALIDAVEAEQADLDIGMDDGSIALVYADPDPDQIDLHVKAGAPGVGVWNNTGIVHAIVAGAAGDVTSDAEAARDKAAEWANSTGAEPGGPGTKSAMEWAELIQAELAGAAANAAGLAALLPGSVLPAVFTHAYIWKKRKDAIVPDRIGTAHCDLATFTGGYGVDADGWITLSGGTQAGKLPAMNHQTLIHVWETPEGGSTGYYIGFGGGGASIGVGMGGSFTNLPKSYAMHGQGPAKVFRRNDASGTGANGFKGGGVVCWAGVAASVHTAGPIIGAASAALAGKVGQCTLYATLVGSGAATDAEIEQGLRWLRPYLASEQRWVRSADCPDRGVHVVIVGESIDCSRLWVTPANCTTNGDVVTVVGGTGTPLIEVGHGFMRTGIAQNNWIKQQLTSTEPGGTLGKRGTYRAAYVMTTQAAQAAMYTPHMTVAQQNMVSRNTFISMRNNQSQADTDIPQMRWSMRPPYHNAAAKNERAVTPSSGWTWGFVRAANEAPDNGTAWYLTVASNGSTQDCPGGTEAAQTTSTNYANAVGGTTNVTGALSRNAKNLVSGGMIGNLVHLNMSRDEQQARKRGIGFVTQIIVESGGINTAYIGTGAIPDVATPLQWFEDKRSFYIDHHGLADPIMVIGMPHLPDGNLDGYGDGILADGTDYPVTGGAGANRLAALQNYRDAVTAFAAAHPNRVFAVDLNPAQLNTAWGDPVHNSFAGNDTIGGDLYFPVIYANRNDRKPVVW